MKHPPLEEGLPAGAKDMTKLIANPTCDTDKLDAWTFRARRQDGGGGQHADVLHEDFQRQSENGMVPSTIMNMQKIRKTVVQAQVPKSMQGRFLSA